MSLIVIIYNVIVSFIFKFLSDFEAHTLINDKLFSYTLKRAFLLIMNMGLVIILLTINYGTVKSPTKFEFLLSGKYSDITSDWYLNIGTILILTMAINISFPLLILITKSVIKWLRVLWDKRCCMKITSKKTKK